MLKQNLGKIKINFEIRIDCFQIVPEPALLTNVKLSNRETKFFRKLFFNFIPSS